MFLKVLEEVKKYNRIIIHRHGRPDGDALGSQIGLKELIIENFPNKKVYVVGDMTERYSFIGKMDIIPDSFYSDALIFILDCSEKSLISDERFSSGEKVIKMDHHIMREKFGDIEVVDESYESCCGLIADFAIKTNLIINRKAASALYTGIVTDSGRFRYDSTSSRTFSIVSKLLESDIDFIEIYNNLYTDDLELVLLRAKFIMKMQLTKKNVAYIMTTQNELKEMNVDIFTVSRSMVNTMAGIKGIDIWVNFTEDVNSRVIVEIRSSKYNINPIAVKFGGGGHAKASGATIASFEEAYKLLECLDELVK